MGLSFQSPCKAVNCCQSSSNSGGLRAAKYLLKGSKRVSRVDKLYGEKINEFRKAGGYQQATADFRTIKPINIKESGSQGQTTTAGRVGDRFIIIRPEGFFETTMVEIVKWHGTSKQHVDVIYYYWYATYKIWAITRESVPTDNFYFHGNNSNLKRSFFQSLCIYRFWLTELFKSLSAICYLDNFLSLPSKMIPTVRSVAYCICPC